MHGDSDTGRSTSVSQERADFDRSVPAKLDKFETGRVEFAFQEHPDAIFGGSGKGFDRAKRKSFGSIDFERNPPAFVLFTFGQGQAIRRFSHQLVRLA